MFNFLKKIIELPGLVLSLIKTIVATLVLVMMAIALYNYKPVKDQVDPVAKKMVENSPSSIKKIAKSTGVFYQRERTFLEKIADKIQGIPSSFLEFFKGGLEAVFNRILDAIFHPIFLIFLIILAVFRLKR